MPFLRPGPLPYPVAGGAVRSLATLAEEDGIAELEGFDLFNPTEEHTALRGMVRSFAETDVRPQALEYNREEKFNRALFNKCGELGLLGVTVPEEYGGSGMDATAAVIVHEELAAADSAFTLACVVTDFIEPTIEERHASCLMSINIRLSPRPSPPPPRPPPTRPTLAAQVPRALDAFREQCRPERLPRTKARVSPRRLQRSVRVRHVHERARRRNGCDGHEHDGNP